jgi:hypothetical protein
MPVQPDPTHPKFLEGDDVLKPPNMQEDDVEGHIQSGAVEEPIAEPEGMKTRITEDDGTDDVEGHMKTR